MTDDVFRVRSRMASTKRIFSRPRTRVYDSNYNIGEAYYKSALDSLDKKSSYSSTSRSASSAVQVCSKYFAYRI
jgi:hypothetical protein